MPANKSEELMVLLGQALNSGDLEAAVALYDPEACVVPEPGTMVKGTAAIRETLTGFLSMKPTITAPPSQVIQTGELAAVFNSWSLIGSGPFRAFVTKCCALTTMHHAPSGANDPKGQPT